MNETRNATLLQRLPKILAVTATSYGLTLQAPGTRKHGAGERKRGDGGKPMASDGKHEAQR